MWGDDELAADLARIKERDFSSLSVSTYQAPAEPFLRFRFHLV